MLTLMKFLLESNKLEGYDTVKELELSMSYMFLELDKVKIADLSNAVNVFTKAHGTSGRLRCEPGLDVSVEGHTAPYGGVFITEMLQKILDEAQFIPVPLTPYLTHVEYEQLHPYMDGNGRSGRLLWLKMMGGLDWLKLTNYSGFLHTWYHQSLR